MTGTQAMQGHCLCGAVTLQVGRHAAGVSACHCGMCRRWSGSSLHGFEAEAAGVSVSGPVKRYRSSAFAERAWCDLCGSQLWIRDDGADYDLMPGLFDAAREMPLLREIYIDRAFASAPLAGDHRRVTAAEYEAEHPFVEDGA